MPLIIGGYEPFSLSDFPGCLSAVVFAQGCNWRCPFCHNPELLAARAEPGQGLGAREVLDRLRRRRGLLQGVVVSGGEPTVQEAGLPGFLAELKALGYRVKLDTNGSRPDILEAVLVARQVDYVAMDIKAPAGQGSYARLAGVDVDLGAVQRSIALIARSGVEHQFRTTWVEPLLRESDREGILALVPPGSVHVWQRFVPERARDPRLRKVELT